MGNKTEGFHKHLNEDQVNALEEYLGKDPQTVETPFMFTKERFGWAEIEHGLTEDGDYVWHFTSHHQRRLFPRNTDHILRIIITFLNNVIPYEVTKTVIPSPEDWDKKVITVKAIGLGKKWNFDQNAINKANEVIGNRINTEIELANPKRKYS